MLIRKIKLENIRSYNFGEIEFPEGSTLLSGNIGAGKSSVLLAIDFALFGISPGIGTALLRKGQERGSVELYFSTDNKEVIIKRSLKKTSSGVSQDEGYLIINGEKIEGSATELKARILGLLNYPMELLTKSKSLIYKYTVYTPQEEMKAILIGDKDSRLETLRKVFGVDKYKRIIQNSEIFIKNLKNKIKEFDIRIEDFDSKINERKEREDELKRIKIELKKIIIEHDQIDFKLKKKREELKYAEAQINERNRTKNELELEKNTLVNYMDRAQRESNEINSLKKEISSLEGELKGAREENIDDLINERANLNKDIASKEREKNELMYKIAEFNTRKNASNELKTRIKELKNCPTCLQEVNDGHKEHITKMEISRISDIEKEIQTVNNDIKKSEHELQGMKDKFEVLNNKVNQSNIISLKFDTLKNKESRLQRFEDQVLEFNSKIKESQDRIIELNEMLNKFEKIEDKYSMLKQEMDEAIRQDKIVGIKRATLEQSEMETRKAVEKLGKNIMEMEKIKNNIDYLRQLQKWLSENFIKIMQMMERKIMLRAHSDFNNLLDKWFSILIEDETIKIKLDEEFTPVITLNEYETDYAHLSGGERTAAALAYRLSLNQVINNLMSDIKTRDLIILDEPTDGFSTEQLDRVKIVLDELNLKQIIIVSHEPKIESFVDNVLRFEKKEHVSRIIN